MGPRGWDSTAKKSVEDIPNAVQMDLSKSTSVALLLVSNLLITC